MEHTLLVQYLVTGLLLTFLFGLVKPNIINDIKGLGYTELMTQIENGQGEHFQEGEQFYRLVLLVNEAVSRGLITTQEQNIRKSTDSGIITDLYKLVGSGRELRLPSIVDVTKAINFFKASSSDPELDRFGSVNTRSQKYIDSVKGKIRANQTPSQTPLATPYQSYPSSPDSLIGRSESYIKRTREQIMKMTPGREISEDGSYKSYPSSPDSLIGKTESFIERQRVGFSMPTPARSSTESRQSYEHQMLHQPTPTAVGHTEISETSSLVGRGMSDRPPHILPPQPSIHPPVDDNPTPDAKPGCFGCSLSFKRGEKDKSG